MNDATLWPLVTAGFGIALVHAALPTHWLPFVLAGRAQRWSHGRTLAVTAAAGGGHAAFTAVLGGVAIGAGAVIDAWSRAMFPYLAGAVLAGFGLWYLRKFVRGEGHSHLTLLPVAHGHDHVHHVHTNDCAHSDDPDHAHHHHPPRTDAAVIVGLLAMLSLSPCEGFLPVFIAGAREGWLGFIGLSAALAVATLAGMLAFTWLTLKGLQHLRLERLARYEHAVVGGLLVTMGAGVWVFET